LKRRTLILVIVLIVVVFLSATLGTCVFIKYKANKTKEKFLHMASEIVKQNTQDKENIEEDKKLSKEELEINDKVIGILKIPKIDLKAPIREGTESDILKYAIGHFVESNFFYGNVALAAHNRGIYSQYFEKINELVKGDEITYITKFGEKVYRVIQIKSIASTDWSVIENIGKEEITLITCVKNRDDLRLCVKGEKINK